MAMFSNPGTKSRLIIGARTPTRHVREGVWQRKRMKQGLRRGDQAVAGPMISSMRTRRKGSTMISAPARSPVKSRPAATSEMTNGMDSLADASCTRPTKSRKRTKTFPVELRSTWLRGLG
jgi:hypothetical protein